MVIDFNYLNGGGGSGSGATGPQGPMGPQGPQGPEGPQGVDGLNGIDGQDGAQGPQGPEGAQGPRGIQGATGAQGPKGEDGVGGDNTILKSVALFPEDAEEGDAIAYVPHLVAEANNEDNYLQMVDMTNEAGLTTGVLMARVKDTNDNWIPIYLYWYDGVNDPTGIQGPMGIQGNASGAPAEWCIAVGDGTELYRFSTHSSANKINLAGSDDTYGAVYFDSATSRVYIINAPSDVEIYTIGDNERQMGIYQYDGSDWNEIGGGDNTILKHVYSVPQDAEYGDVVALAGREGIGIYQYDGSVWNPIGGETPDFTSLMPVSSFPEVPVTGEVVAIVEQPEVVIESVNPTRGGAKSPLPPIQEVGIYQFNGREWVKIGGGSASGYKIELSDPDPSNWTQSDYAAIDAFSGALTSNPAILDNSYIIADERIFRLSWNDYNGGGTSFKFTNSNPSDGTCEIYFATDGGAQSYYQCGEGGGGGGTPTTLCGFGSLEEVEYDGNYCDLFVLYKNSYALHWEGSDFHMVDNYDLYEAGTLYRVADVSGHTIDFVYDDGNFGNAEGYSLVVDENGYVDWRSYDDKPYELELGDGYIFKFQYYGDYYHMYVEDGNGDEQPFGDYAETFNQLLQANVGTYSYDENYQDGPEGYENYRRLAFADEIEGGGSGSQGPQGPEGPQGPAGQNGTNGSQGPQGETGAQGPQGPAGSGGGGGSSYISDLQPLGINILEGQGVGFADDPQTPTQYTTIEPQSDGSAYVCNYTDDGQGGWMQSESYQLLRMEDIKNDQDDLLASGIIDGNDRVLKVDPDSDGTTQVGGYEPGEGDAPTFTRERYLVSSTNISKMVKITSSDYDTLVNNQEVDENTFYIVVPDPQIGE